jgi:Domain of unknown function (DUF397)
MTTWRVSSYSGSQGECVEVGRAERAVVVRDTKDRAGAVLRVSAETWRAFAASIRARQPVS